MKVIITRPIATLATISETVQKVVVNRSGIQGPKGDAGSINWISEQPAGAINGINPTFVLSQTPAEGSLSLSVNGLTQTPGVSADYVIGAATITFNAGAIPQIGDTVFAGYSY